MRLRIEVDPDQPALVKLYDENDNDVTDSIINLNLVIQNGHVIQSYIVSPLEVAPESGIEVVQRPSPFGPM